MENVVNVWTKQNIYKTANVVHVIQRIQNIVQRMNAIKKNVINAKMDITITMENVENVHRQTSIIVKRSSVQQQETKSVMFVKKDIT